MRTCLSNTLQVSRLRPLAACLAMAFSCEIFAGPTRGDAAIVPLHQAYAAHGAVNEQRGADHPNTPQTWTVQNCHDSGTDSLRDIVQNPNKAQSGDTVDLSQLPTLCGMAASTITLSSGEITINQDDLALMGPTPGNGSVTISGGGQFLVLNHQGTGTLGLRGLTIKDGYNLTVAEGHGGCVGSNGSVDLNRTVVTGCTVLSNTGYALGGGIFAHDVTMVLSSVSGNDAIAPSKRGLGGGIHAFNLVAKYSSISANVAHDGLNGSAGSFGGGAYAQTTMSIYTSLIDGNKAGFGGGLEGPADVHIENSTISGNFADQDYGALRARSDSLTISNSTIAFNHSDSTFSGPTGAVSIGGPPSSILDLQSSIVADNTATDQNVPADIYIPTGHGNLTGADNLVIAANVVPMPGVITVTADPKLGPLQFNGGWTLTHALLAGSPALGVGNNNALQQNDQRGRGYPRTTGTGANVTTDMGAIEFDSIFSDDFD